MTTTTIREHTMIGHVFASSGATCLALAPSAERPDEYVVLARTETGYAVAHLLSETLGRDGGPQYWLRGEYYDQHEDAERDRAEAAAEFATATGLTGMDPDRLVAHIEHAEQTINHRKHLAGSGA